MFSKHCGGVGPSVVFGLGSTHDWGLRSSRHDPGGGGATAAAWAERTTTTTTTTEKVWAERHQKQLCKHKNNIKQTKNIRSTVHGHIDD